MIDFMEMNEYWAKYYEVPAYLRNLPDEDIAKLEADLEGYKPTVQEYWLPTFKL